VVAAWFVGGVVILVLAARGTGRGATGKALDQITPRMALWIGLAQCLALWPGTSRSLVTILGGVLVGFELVAAVEFSFLLGVVTLGAATAYKTLDSGRAMLDAYGMPTLLVGFVAATISAALAVKWLVAYLSRHDMKVFGYYRIALAVVVAVLMGAGVLS
jgi:undecaprenyl-diphosphatase